MKNVIRSIMSDVDFAGIGVMLITYILASLVTGLFQLWHDGGVFGKLNLLIGFLPMMIAVWVTSEVCEKYRKVKTVFVNTAFFCAISVALLHILNNITVQSYYGVALTVFMLLSVINVMFGIFALWSEAAKHIPMWTKKVKGSVLFVAWYVVSLVGGFSMASIVGYAVCNTIYGC